MAGTRPVWMVRCEGGTLYAEFRERQLIALGNSQREPDLSGAKRREDVEARLVSHRQWDSRNKLGYSVGVLTRFAIEIQAGDAVVTYEPSARVYSVGKVIGGYEYHLDWIQDKQHYRRVDWIGEVDRDVLTPESRNSLASMVSVYRLSDQTAAEIEAAIRGTPAEVQDAEDIARDDFLREDFATKAREQVKDRVAHLDWSQMQELVAGILRAMGYKTRVSPAGPDRGRDILASPDGLGLEQPRIVVEVKHRSGQIGAPDIRSFIGGLQAADRGLYVSSGGFTREARYEADRSTTPVTLIDVDELVSLLLEHYEAADSRLTALVPLVSIYWPAD
ncbi:MAG: restriction endonuclease [Phycisphaerales bacterium]|nr:restriction endonuclease [Phycisphaerales bacterium]